MLDFIFGIDIPRDRVFLILSLICFVIILIILRFILTLFRKLDLMEKGFRRETDEMTTILSGYLKGITATLLQFVIYRIKEDLASHPEKLFDFGRCIGNVPRRISLELLHNFCDHHYANLKSEISYFSDAYALLEQYDYLMNYPQREFTFSAETPRDLIKEKERFSKIYEELISFDKKIREAIEKSSFSVAEDEKIIID